MKNKGKTAILILAFVIFLAAFFGKKEFEKSVNESDGKLMKYNYESGSEDDNVSVTVSSKDSWLKDMGEGFTKNSHFTDSEYARRNDVNHLETIGRTVEVTVTNNSDFRINKWNIEYTAPADMYIDKAWNGTIEIHQFGGENVETIDARENPSPDTKLEYDAVDELYLYPVKKGDRIVYIPEEHEVPLVEEFAEDGKYSTVTIGFIFYTEEDMNAFERCTVNYYLVKSLEEYPLYNILRIIEVISAVFVLGAGIFIFVSVRYEKTHQHDMEIISQAIGTFSKFIDSKDKYTNNHSYRVAEYSRLISRKLGLSSEECEDIYYIGLLHDTGKIVIDDKILNKPGRLTSQEYEVIKSHTTKGADLLKDFTAIKNITVGALYHHERYDGKGYPSGMIGEEIPLVARIICVADSYDAMSSTRCYRAELEKEKIVEQLVINKGKQFDPHIVDVFLELLESGEVDQVRRNVIES